MVQQSILGGGSQSRAPAMLRVAARGASGFVFPWSYPTTLKLWNMLVPSTARKSEFEKYVFVALCDHVDSPVTQKHAKRKNNDEIKVTNQGRTLNDARQTANKQQQKMQSDQK